MQHGQKITADFIRQQSVYFQPRTDVEAIEIQERLFALGCAWVDTGVGVWKPEACVGRGISVGRDLKMGLGRRENGQDVSLADFDAFDVTAMMSSPEKHMYEKFNELSAKVDALTQMVERLLEKIDPPPLEKPDLRRKGAAYGAEP